MAPSEDNILQAYNRQNPRVKLTYQLFEFPATEEILIAKNKGLLVASYNLAGTKTILNSVYKKGTGLEGIEENLIAKIIKLVNPI